MSCVPTWCARDQRAPSSLPMRQGRWQWAGSSNPVGAQRIVCLYFTSCRLYASHTPGSDQTCAFGRSHLASPVVQHSPGSSMQEKGRPPAQLRRMLQAVSSCQPAFLVRLLPLIASSRSRILPSRIMNVNLRPAPGKSFTGQLCAGHPLHALTSGMSLSLS
jgi:hypothetical protein